MPPACDGFTNVISSVMSAAPPESGTAEAGLAEAAAKPLAPPSPAAFPILPTGEEEPRIDAFMSVLADRLTQGRQKYNDVRNGMGKKTEMVVPELQRDLFGQVFTEEFLFDRVQEHHFRAVLLVALRFRWEPAQILALWQNEGLGAPRVQRVEGTKPLAEPLSDYYKDAAPAQPNQARAWARSALLWQRWGLDALAPIIRVPGEDNKLREKNKDDMPLSKATHDAAFNAGFQSEIGNLLPENPLTYLSSPKKPIAVDKRDTGWWFWTDPEYQTTLLALQSARFHKKIAKVPTGIVVESSTIDTTPAFPAIVYMYYNSPNADTHLLNLASALVAVGPPEKTHFDCNDLYAFFVSRPIPDSYVQWLVDHGRRLNNHSYINALRFEAIYQVYQTVFEGFSTEPVPVVVPGDGGPQ